MATNTTTTPRVPIQTPMYDTEGKMTRPWILFLERLGNGTFIDQTLISTGELKATFGLVKPLTTEGDLTNRFICRTGGTYTNVVVNTKTPPTGTAARLVIEKSTDEGASWTNIFASPAYIELAIGDDTLQEYSNFVAAPNNVIEPGDMLRINCNLKGSLVPGKDIEVVLRWE